MNYDYILNECFARLRANPLATPAQIVAQVLADADAFKLALLNATGSEIPAAAKAVIVAKLSKI